MERVLVFTSLLLLLSVTAVRAQQSPRELFEHARLLEERNSDLREAISLYDRVAKDPNGERRLAAEARLRVGVLHERLGRSDQAQQVYAQVARDYADQTAVASRARARLRPATSAPEEDDGIVLMQVWTGPGGALSRPSPDGRLLSYVDWNTGNLAFYDRTEGESRRLTNKGTWSDSDEYAEVSVWAPDGRKIVYSWFNESFYELRTIGVEGGSATTLYSNPEIDYLWPAAWSEDGREVLAVLITPDKTGRIALIDAESGEARILKSLKWRSPRTMSLSPDGRFIAYDLPVSPDQDERDIFLLAADGSREETVVQSSSSDFGPVFTPDGRHLLFISQRRGSLDLWALPLDNGRSAGEPKLIKENIGAVRPLGCTADGTYFYSTSQTMDDIYTAAIDRASGSLGEARLVTDRFQGRNTKAEWSPDGTLLAFISNRRDGARLQPFVVVRDTATGKETDINLPFALRGGRTNLSWSRGEDALFVAGLDDKGRRDLYRVDVHSRTTELISRLNGNVQEVWAAADGRLFYLRNDGERVDLIAHDVETHEEEELYRSYHIHVAAPSPDARYIAFSTADELPDSGVANSTILKVLSVASGAVRELARVSEKQEITAITWMPDGRELLYLAGSQSGSDLKDARLLRMAIDGGEAVPYALDLPPTTLPTVRFHPDVEQIVYTSGEATTEVWAVENYLSQIAGTQ